MKFNYGREYIYMTTLLAIVFIIAGVGLIWNAVPLALNPGPGVFLVILIAIGVLYIKDGIFSFIEGMREIVSGEQTPGSSGALLDNPDHLKKGPQ